ncbi:prepilin peptidase [Prosthecochloris sp. GSB1]|uniref:prepilin peptidase n=1 Tax=Prosthecochloris sp. GSB1 TaxID=281093 RepID=UPI000B8CC0A0|nr:A24 family peptidase [Prosthecochloris sp. GSB1]ASQ90252.1 prepilin peptidase [Prosthecochloris sp. GSB1]
MIFSRSLDVLWAHWPWWWAGAVIGLWLASLARMVPRRVLQSVDAPLHEWRGPGGGLEQPVPPTRRIWVPAVNAWLWAYAAENATHPAFWGTFPWAALASALLLLAIIDWDTTLLPDRVVLPLGLAGLAGSHAGVTAQGLVASAASAVVVLGLLGGAAWMFRRIKGERGIGGGDIKLLTALAAWWGVVGVLYIVLWASVGTVVWYFLWRRFNDFEGEAEWPFGPAIVMAALAWGL